MHQTAFIVYLKSSINRAKAPNALPGLDYNTCSSREGYHALFVGYLLDTSAVV